MPQPNKRSALDVLTKACLIKVAQAFELGVAQNKPKSEFVEAIAASKRASFTKVLDELNRDELKEICRVHGLDDSGKERRIIIDRILGRLPTEAAEVGPGYRYQSVLAAVDPDAEFDPSRRKKRSRSDAKDGRANTAPTPIEPYEHAGKTRTNNPPVGLVTPETDPPGGKKAYRHDPHIDPALQFDAGGSAGTAAKIEDLIDEGIGAGDLDGAKAALRRLKELREPYLSWAGKAERTTFEVPTVSLHVHERIDPRTIVETVRRGDRPASDPQASQMGLFEHPSENRPLREAIDFYKHEHNWSNRLIAGDSLLVMNSLLEKEGMAGKVQMVYLDPPYGIRYGSNFQPFVGSRRVHDGADEDLTQEPETIKAFRDTWELGIHSYLGYLHDRLVLVRDLLAASGSCFVQIGDENLHRVRLLLDEAFGSENFVAVITFKTGSGFVARHLKTTSDYLLWYAKDISQMTFRRLFRAKESGTDSNFDKIQLLNGKIVEIDGALPPGAHYVALRPLVSAFSPNTNYRHEFNSTLFYCGDNRSWKTTPDGMQRLEQDFRIYAAGRTLKYVARHDDFPLEEITHVWDDTMELLAKNYVVQTTTKVLARCILMTTDPGDLVFDPTCGSGTTAFVAERWGRRWITCDTSRVAVTLAKQRLMTSTFDYYRLAHGHQGISSGFIYKTVPHVTLKSIANNPEIRPGMSRSAIDAVIARYAKPETLYDQPEVDASRLRVTGPFTVEAVPAPVVQPVTDIDVPAANDAAIAREGETLRQADWREELRRTGVRGKGGNMLKFVRVEPLAGARYLHADAEVVGNREAGPLAGKRVVVSFGPEYAPLEQRQVELAWEEARALEPKPALLLFAAFEFDPEAAKDIDAIPPEKAGMTLLKAKMNGDLFTDDLKKKRTSNESFWLVGQPDVEVRQVKTGEQKGKWEVEVRGFDYFNPKTGEIESGDTRKIALWFLDPDYDGRSLYPRQVFFPMAGPKDGWARLAKSLRAEIDEERIEAYRGVVSLPFERGKFGRVAIKIVDDRGIESLVARELERGLRREPARSADASLEQVAQELVDVLAKVAHDSEAAKTIARRAGFPLEHLPEFRTAIGFWGNIVEQAIHGRIGLEALVREVVRHFPYNSKLKEYQIRIRETGAGRTQKRGVE